MKDEKDCSFDNRAFQRLKSFRTSAALVLTTLMLVVAATTGATAQTFKTLLSFDGTDGKAVLAGLVQATDGNLYGTTYEGGAHGVGTVFKITPSGTLNTLYNFCSQSGCTDGEYPEAGLVQATDGNFYGTTSEGGGTACNGLGCGTVFKITPSGTLTTLHSFDGTDGILPVSGLVQATDGNFYGTTNAKGANGYGTVFKITPSGTLNTLHNFCSQSGCTDGEYPFAGLVQATNGNLYGTTFAGGAHGVGTVFKITPSGTLNTLHNFCSQSGCTDGANPFAGLVQATDGNLYGTTSLGGAHTCALDGCGTVFKITPSGTLNTLYSFDGTDGLRPDAGLVQATDGNFYGTTGGGGSSACNGLGCGTVFKITASGTLNTLHSFDITDGSSPYAGLVQATNANLYGTTEFGGANNYGTVFSLSVGLGAFVETKPTSGKEGAKIGILGQGFSSSSVVKFGGTQATTIVLSGTTFITATVPADALTGKVTVTTGSTTLTSSQTFKVLPTITGFTPSSGSVGTAVMISGTGLAQTTAVKFGGVKQPIVTVNSDTQVTADVPTGAKTGKIAVTTKGGSATSTTSFTVN
jgi:uncharacterized repeat protein (TIGR03803 family)